VEGYASDQEQLESIKRWWRTNGKSVLLGVAIGAGIIIGWRVWSNHQATQAELAAGQYEQVLADMKRGDKAAAVDRGARLVEDQRGTPYAALTAFALAKIKLEDKDQQGARFYLQWVVDNAKDAQLKSVARLRLAQVLLAGGDGAAALAALDGVNAEAYALPLQELKGDILMELKRVDDARGAYSAALAAATEQGGDHQRIQMKLAALGGAKAS